MKFLCDAMLGHLGRRLRAAGYDTRIAHGTHRDREFVALARAERRFFLTCDRHIHEIKGADSVLVYLPENSEAAWTAYLTTKFGVDWLHAAFTRCLDCNSLLEPAPSELRAIIPEDSRHLPAFYCPNCRKVFWEGSHTREMRRKLGALNELRD